MNFIIDTREQKPLRLKKAISICLAVGDYSVEDFEDDIAYERKSVSDLYKCLGRSDIKRFKSQLLRLSKIKHRGLLIESTWTSVGWGFLYSPLPGAVAQQKLIELVTKYDIPVYFVQGRDEAVSLLTSLMSAAYKDVQKCRIQKKKKKKQ